MTYAHTPFKVVMQLHCHLQHPAGEQQPGMQGQGRAYINSTLSLHLGTRIPLGGVLCMQLTIKSSTGTIDT